MPVFTLECIDQDWQNTFWTLHLEPDYVLVSRQNGPESTRFPRSEATERIDMPSFWRSNPGLSIQFADGRWRCFKKNSGMLPSVQYYLDRTLAATGAESVVDLRRRGLKYMALGI